jgi:hypothetical protein
MMVRKAAGRALALLGASATLALGVGCEHRNGDINRVQPGYQRKEIFANDSEWYYRRTIAKSETTNSFIVEGHGDIPLDRVKFNIQESVLIAYKPYEAIPGAQTYELPGGDQFFEGTVLAAWPILYHFDITRVYDPITGNETNVLMENTADRVWYERDYMRVDWASNLVEGSLFGDYSGYWFPVSYVSTGSYWTNLETRPTDPYASRFSDDYVEVTDNALLGMDLFMCYAFTGYSFTQVFKCGFGEAKVRHSFVRIAEPSDYVPRAYPDSVVRKDANGQTTYDPETGEVVREHYYNRFGVFRIEVPTYDRGYGLTESGRLFRAMLFNLWENWTDANGNDLPYAQRTPKPIIYYLNTEYPPRYRQAAAEVGVDYGRIYTSMVADLQGKSVDALKAEIAGRPNGGNGEMFQVRDNDCNEDHIISFVSENPDLLFAVERAVCKDGEACDLGVNDLPDVVGIGNLETVCSSLEQATMDMTTGKSEFEWQRIGDARYNMVVWLNNPQRSPWGGYGPMHADARTGETVSATAFLRGNSYEIGAASIADYIELINDEKSVSEIIFGQDIRKHAAETLRRRGDLERSGASDAYIGRMMGRLSALGATKEERLIETPDPNHLLNRMKKIEGTRAEEVLVNEMQLMMAGNGGWRPGQAMTEDLWDLATPAGRMNLQNPTAVAQRRARSALGAAGFCFLNHEFDNDWVGLALKLKDNPRYTTCNDAGECVMGRYEIAANRLIKHVMLHELGHNVGLAHNFEGSYDALNYPNQFWQLHWASDQEKLEGQYLEFRNTTVMEYLSGKGAFSDALGKYDEAALRFAYGNQVATFSSPSVDASLAGGESLRNWRYYNDYRKIPDYLCGAGGCASDDVRRDVINTRSWVDFDPQDPPANEVPYLFCDNYYDRMTPFCATFDYGSNLREIHANYYSMWSDYFFFRNFARDRQWPFGWTPQAAMSAVYFAMSNLDVVAQYFYYMNAVDPTFDQTDLNEDMAVTLAHGLNMAAEIMSTPEPIRMCPWPGTQPPVYIPHYFLNDCDEYADLNSAYAIRAEAIQVPLGDARPSTLGLTEDYEEWQWEFVGSYFDKSNVMYLLGWTQPTLFRFNYDLDVRNYFISLYRIFEPELRQFYGNLINLDGYFLRSETAETLGSYWCRDPNAPDVAHLGAFEPRKLIDPAAMNQTSLPGPSAECLNPAVVYPELLTNMPFEAMYIAHAMFSSDFDGQLDMGKSLKVYVVGADDDFVDWSTLRSCEVSGAGETCYCGLTDSLTGLQYRSISQPDGVPNLGCRMIERALEAQDNYEIDQGPYAKDNWRQWIEKLEYARDLYRLYHTRAD